MDRYISIVYGLVQEDIPKLERPTLLALSNKREDVLVQLDTNEIGEIIE